MLSDGLFLILENTKKFLMSYSTNLKSSLRKLSVFKDEILYLNVLGYSAIKIQNYLKTTYNINTSKLSIEVFINEKNQNTQHSYDTVTN